MTKIILIILVFILVTYQQSFTHKELEMEIQQFKQPSNEKSILYQASRERIFETELQDQSHFLKSEQSNLKIFKKATNICQIFDQLFRLALETKVQKIQQQISFRMQGQKYKKIKIQQLEARPQPKVDECSRKSLLVHLAKDEGYLNEQILCYIDTGLNKQRLLKSVSPFNSFDNNFFFNAFYHAYMHHGDVVLVPDQIWIMITSFVSKYIDDNAEKLRRKLVKHQGVKTLVVREQAQNQQEAVQMEKQWDVFFERIIQQIKKETVHGAVDNFICDFTTTTNTYKVISSAVIMNSLKKFFKYERDIGILCGVNNVYMAGTREDWSKMIPKLENLNQYDVNGELKQYIEYIKAILTNLLDTYDEKPNVKWWNSMMTTEQKYDSYYGVKELVVQGWILHFFGIYYKQKFDGFPHLGIEVPIVLKNQGTMKEKTLALVADWVSVSKLNQKAYKPDMGLMIIQKDEKPLKL